MTAVNSLVIGAFILLSGWAIYETACQIFDGISVNGEAQQFKSLLLQYLWIFIILFFILGSLIQYYCTRRLLKPLKQMINSMESLKKGNAVEPIVVTSNGEMGQLILHVNELLEQLRYNDVKRHKLVSDLSHEFRTPLTNLDGYLKALQTGVIKADSQLFRSLQQESNRLIYMLKQFDSIDEYEYIQHQKFIQKQEVDIENVLAQVLRMFNWSMRNKDIRYESYIAPQQVHIEPNGIIQVVSNLLENAIRYYKGTEPIKISGKRENKYYIISIEGPGQYISDQERQLLFERDYRSTTNNEGNGKGLGLAISKEIITQHGGTINLSTDGHSHIFSFTIPV